jgi:glycogen phosphorylase
MFDNIVNPDAAGWRERFEAFARSVRDILSQNWLKTDETYAKENPKRVYYPSMEFLIGRSLANNVTNLLLDPITKGTVKDQNLDWLRLLDQEPDAGLGNGGLGHLAACFLDSMATRELPAMGYGLRYEYGIFKQTIRRWLAAGTAHNWLRSPDPWEVARPEPHGGVADAVLYPDDSTTRGKGFDFCRSTSSSRARWRISCDAFVKPAITGICFPRKSPFS